MTTLYNTRVQVPASSSPAANSLYDDAALKPTGGAESDICRDAVGSSLSSAFIKRNNSFQISTFNSRTLNPLSRKHELTNSAFINHNDIICIQEHRQYHSETIRIENINAYRLITSSATKNSQNASIGGVGFLISPRVFKSLNSVEKINSRIILLHIKGNPKLTVICCYAPTNTSDDKDKDDFYYSLSRTVTRIPAHNVLAVCGDFNSKLGPDVIKHSYHPSTNDNGDRLHDFSLQHKMVNLNGYFQKPSRKSWTYEDPYRTRHQLDHILWRKKWINSVSNCQAYNTMSSVGSDHRLVTCFARISYRVNKKPPSDPISKVDWKSLTHDSDLRYQYSLEVKNKYSSLLEENTLEHDYGLLARAVTETAVSKLPRKRPKRRDNPFNSQDITRKREVLQKTALLHRTCPSHETKDSLESAKKSLDTAYATATSEYLNKRTKELEAAHEEHRHTKSWRIIRELSASGSTPLSKIPGNDSSERLDTWYTHFNNLLGAEPPDVDLTDPFYNQKVSDPLPIDCSAFTSDELSIVLRSLSNNKSPGLDHIPAEVWKEESLKSELLYFCNQALVHGTVPEEWTTSAIIPVPKKGDLSKPGNYRGIALSPVAAKIFNKLLLNRIVPFIDPILRDNQNGFRRGRSTVTQIISIRRLLEEYKIGKKSLAITFVDFSKAFDSINRNALFHILNLYGIPAPLVLAIKRMYDSSTSKVKTPEGLTDAFATLMGVLQGDTLAPFLFVIVVDYLLRQSMKPMNGLTVRAPRSRRDTGFTLTDLDFADDLALLSDTIEKAQNLLSDLESAAEKVGLRLNAGKTEYMTLNIDEDADAIVSSSGTQLKQEQDFKYLGSYDLHSCDESSVMVCMPKTPQGLVRRGVSRNPANPA